MSAITVISGGSGRNYSVVDTSSFVTLVRGRRGFIKISRDDNL